MALNICTTASEALHFVSAQWDGGELAAEPQFVTFTVASGGQPSRVLMPEAGYWQDG